MVLKNVSKIISFSILYKSKEQQTFVSLKKMKLLPLNNFLFFIYEVFLFFLTTFLFHFMLERFIEAELVAVELN